MGHRAWVSVFALLGCSQEQRWLPFPELDGAATRLLVIDESPPVAQLIVGPTLTIEADSTATLFLFGFDETTESLGIRPGRRTPEGPALGPGELDCSALAERFFRSDLGSGQEGWSPVGVQEVPKGFHCRRAVTPEEECLTVGASARVLVRTTSAAPGALELLPDGRVLLTLADGHAYAVSRSEAEPLPEIEAFLRREGYAITAGWVDEQGRYWLGGSLDALARGELSGSAWSLQAILPSRQPGQIEALGESIAALTGRSTAQGVELFAITNLYRFLRYQEGAPEWEVLSAPPPPIMPSGLANVAVLPDGRAAAALGTEPGLLYFDPAQDPPLAVLRDPAPGYDRPTDLVLADGDTFVVAFPRADTLAGPKDLYRLVDRRWLLLGFIPPSDNGTLTGLLLGDSILLSETNGNWALFPSAADCPPERFTQDGADVVRQSGPDELVMVGRMVDKLEVQVLWQQVGRAPGP